MQKRVNTRKIEVLSDAMPESPTDKSEIKEKHPDKHNSKFFQEVPLMAMEQEQQQRQSTWNNGISPEQLLSNAYKTIGKEMAEELGLHCTSSRLVRGRYEVFTFDMDHLKLLERRPGNIAINVSHVALNSSKFDDAEGVSQARHYGGLTGTAGVNMRGWGSLRDQFPCIVIPDHKYNPMQRHAVNASFAELMGKLKGVEAAEVNPAAINVFESFPCVNGIPEFRIVVIEASGLFGECKNRPFNWSVMQHPVEKPASSTTKPAQTSRTTRRKTPETTPADDQLGDSAEVEREMANTI